MEIIHYLNFLKDNTSSKNIIDDKFKISLELKLKEYLSKNNRSKFEKIYTEAFIFIELMNIFEISNYKKEDFLKNYFFSKNLTEEEINNILKQIFIIQKLPDIEFFLKKVEYLICIINYKLDKSNNLLKHIENFYFFEIIKYNKNSKIFENKYKNQIIDNDSIYQDIVYEVLKIFRKHLEKPVNKIFSEYSYSYFFKIFENFYIKSIKKQDNNILYIEDFNTEENPEYSNTIISEYYYKNKEKNVDEEELIDFEKKYYNLIVNDFIEIKVIIFSFIRNIMKNIDIAKSFNCSDATITRIYNKLISIMSYYFNNLDSLLEINNIEKEKFYKIKNIYNELNDLYQKEFSLKIEQELLKLQINDKNIIEQLVNFKRIIFIKELCNKVNIKPSEFCKNVLEIQNNFPLIWKNPNLFRDKMKIYFKDITEQEIRHLYYFNDKITDFIIDNELSENFIGLYKEYFETFKEDFRKIIKPCDFIIFTNILSNEYSNFYNLNENIKKELIFSFFSSNNRNFEIEEQKKDWVYKNFKSNTFTKIIYFRNDNKLEINDLILT